MNLYLALTLFSLVILVYLTISELFTILFRFTGLPDEKARFQVTSLLTGCGYTTRESELFLSSRSRRRLARVTMLFGYVFYITIVSAIINVFMSFKESQLKDFLFGFLIPIVLFVAVIILVRVPAFRSWSQRVLEKLAGKVLRMDADNYVMVMDYIDENSIAQVNMRKTPEEFRGKSLAETELMTKHNILVLLIEHPGRKPIPANASAIFRDGDKLTVFGKYDEICKVFNAKEVFSDYEESPRQASRW